MSLRLNSQSHVRRLLRTPADGGQPNPVRTAAPSYRCIAESGDIDITFFIACYNEEHGIIPTVQTILAAMADVDTDHPVHGRSGGTGPDAVACRGW